MIMRGAGYRMITVLLMAIESVINICLILASLHLRHSQMQTYDSEILRLENIAESLCKNVDEFEAEIQLSCWKALGLLLVTFSTILVHQFFWTSYFEAVYGAFFCTFITFLHLMQITVAAAAVCIICKHLNKRVRTDKYFTESNFLFMVYSRFVN